MKLLFLCSSRFDYLQDLTFSGLVKMLGQDSVIDHPQNIKYRLRVKDYPKNLGYAGVPFRLLPFNIKEVDAVVLGSAKKKVLQHYEKLLPKIKDKPVIFLDGGDREDIGGDFYRIGIGDQYENLIKKRPFDLVMKREYLPHLHAHLTNVYPFPFSFPWNISMPMLGDEQKKYDVSFWAQQQPAIREKALRLLQGKYDCDRNGTTLNQNFSTYKRRGKFYLEELTRCRIVLNFRGGGWDTMRYWEVPAAGSLLISQRPQIVIPDNFEDRKNIVWCDDSLDDLIDIIDYYLGHAEERQQIAHHARQHLEAFHLNTHRAAFLINKITEHFSIY